MPISRSLLYITGATVALTVTFGVYRWWTNGSLFVQTPRVFRGRMRPGAANKPPGTPYCSPEDEHVPAPEGIPLIALSAADDAPLEL